METLVSIFSNLRCSENSLAAAQKISEFFSTANKLLGDNFSKKSQGNP
jgi:hypothetical protein